MRQPYKTIVRYVLIFILLFLISGYIAFFSLVSGLRKSRSSGALNKIVASKPVKKLMAWELVGEEIVYDVKFGSLNLGESVFRYDRQEAMGDSVIDVVIFETKMPRFIDREVIYSDAGTYLPVRVERSIRTPLSHESITEYYDQKDYSLRIAKKKGEKIDESRIKKDAPLQNAILLPYFVRRLEKLSVGWSFQAHLPTQEFVIRLVSIDRVKVPAGEFNAYHFTSDPKKFEIWVSADERRIPVKIKGLGLVGYVMLMKSYHGGTPQSVP